VPVGSYWCGDDARGPGGRGSQLLYCPPDCLRSPSLPQEKTHTATRIVCQRVQKATNRWSNRRRRKVRFHTLSPESAVAERPQCSARSVFLAIGPTGNGPRDSSCVHDFERTQTVESPAARSRAPDFPHLAPCGRADDAGEGRARPTGESVVLSCGREGRGSVSPRYALRAIGRTAPSALSFLIARATRAQPRASARAASSGSPRHASGPSQAR
jgi:hypothetical protein